MTREHETASIDCIGAARGDGARQLKERSSYRVEPFRPPAPQVAGCREAKSAKETESSTFSVPGFSVAGRFNVWRHRRISSYNVFVWQARCAPNPMPSRPLRLCGSKHLCLSAVQA